MDRTFDALVFDVSLVGGAPSRIVPGLAQPEAVLGTPTAYFWRTSHLIPFEEDFPFPAPPTPWR